MNGLPASPPASLCNEFHLLLLKLLGNCQTPGLGLALPRGSRCLLGAEIAFWALSFPRQLLRPTADVGGGVSRAARIRSTHGTQGGVAETRAEEDRLQVSDSKDGGGKQGKKRGLWQSPAKTWEGLWEGESWTLRPSLVEGKRKEKQGPLFFLLHEKHPGGWQDRSVGKGACKPTM